MRLREFLDRVVEGYLFHDLETMRTAQVTTEDGHCGYPMVMSCLSGVELLGLLSGTASFGPSAPVKEPKPSESFLNYWEHYLYTASPRREVGWAIYQLLRHGIAHTFAGKAPVAVTRYQMAGPHLTNGVHQGVALVIVDADQLYADLKSSYYGSFVPVAEGKGQGPRGEDASTMQARVDDFFAYSADKAAKHGSLLQLLPQAPPLSPPPSPSGPAAPGHAASVPITQSLKP